MSNEDRICEVIITLLERRTNEARNNLQFPERDRIHAPVERVFELGETQFAVEHTEIEPYENHIKEGKMFSEVIGPIIDELSRNLPSPGVYSLNFPQDPKLGTPKHLLAEKRAALRSWISDKAQELNERLPKNLDRNHLPHGHEVNISGTPEGFPYQIELLLKVHWSISSRHDGILLPARYIDPNNLEAKRRCRLEKALRTKQQKLQQCKNDHMRTILVLEYGDISLTNCCLVADQLSTLLPQRPEWLDELYLVDASIDDYFTIYEWNWQNLFWKDQSYEFKTNEIICRDC